MQGSGVWAWLRQVLERLAPGQGLRGDAGVQIGKVDGNVRVVHVTHHHHGRARGPASTEQREVLALLRTLPERGLVLEFMHREFGTRMVIELAPAQLYRVRRYVEKINESRREQA